MARGHSLVRGGGYAMEFTGPGSRHHQQHFRNQWQEILERVARSNKHDDRESSALQVLLIGEVLIPR